MDEQDKYLWLEEVQGKKALQWVTNKNNATLDILTKEPLFQTFHDELHPIMYAKDRLITGQIRENYLYNFWQDKGHSRGIWRRIQLEHFSQNPDNWEVLLDIDALAEKENENWTWGGASCLDENPALCLIYLSRGGKDAFVAREFDLEMKEFVAGGFFLPEAKSRVSWYDKDTLIIGTDWGSQSLTTSGYPKDARIWRRGEDWKSAALLHSGESSDVHMFSYPLRHNEHKIHVIHRAYNFFAGQRWLYSKAKGLTPLEIPDSARIQGFAFGHVLATIQDALTIEEKEYSKGSLLAWPVDTNRPPSLIFEPNDMQSSSNVTVTKDAIIVSILDKVQSRLLAFSYDSPSNSWKKQQIDVPEMSSVTLNQSHVDGSKALVIIESFTEPASTCLLNTANNSFELNVLQSGVRRFDASKLSTTQIWATSKDGTKIPYFVIGPQNLEKNGNHPTLLTGYGGFLISRTPAYLSQWGKGWLERGGILVLANIRGGGEFGPRWHQSALKDNRQRAFDDFIAVAEDLIDQKITSPKKLGISGGSNGGLLVGAVTTQRPELFSAVLCSVPLLDMLRFHKLLAGASWIAEYGSPDDKEMRAYIKSYSPYHNIKKEKSYPKVFFLTSTLDDRVHPGHARKMAAKMEELGHQSYYYENTEGGHGGAANIEQHLKMQALRLTYLCRQLSG